MLKKKVQFGESHLIKIIYNSLLGMGFIHLTNVIHRDIKPGNLLLTSTCDVKVCDFGLARSISKCPTKDLQPLNSINVRQTTHGEKDLSEKLIKDQPRR